MMLKFMSKQVGKSDVFTKTTLVNLQNKMRTLCIESFNKEYKSIRQLSITLKNVDNELQNTKIFPLIYMNIE